MKKSIYSFEGEGRRALTVDEADTAIKELGAKLGFESLVIGDHKDDLIEFILNHHEVISRYQKLRDKEETKRNWYIVGSFSLLIFIPILIYGVSLLPGASGNAAQITAILTSLLAVQKAMSSWLDKRKVIGGFWKAESEIKTLLYEFEDKWIDRAVEIVTQDGKQIKQLKQDFVDNAKASVKASRKIVNTEKENFFNSFSYPAIDVENILSSVVPKSKAMLKSHASQEYSNAESKRMKVNEQQDKISQIRAEIEGHKEIIEDTKSLLLEADGSNKDNLESEINKYRADLRLKENDLILATKILDTIA